MGNQKSGGERIESETSLKISSEIRAVLGWKVGWKFRVKPSLWITGAEVHCQSSVDALRAGSVPVLISGRMRVFSSTKALLEAWLWSWFTTWIFLHRFDDNFWWHEDIMIISTKWLLCNQRWIIINSLLLHRSRKSVSIHKLCELLVDTTSVSTCAVAFLTQCCFARPLDSINNSSTRNSCHD